MEKPLEGAVSFLPLGREPAICRTPLAAASEPIAPEASAAAQQTESEVHTVGTQSVDRAAVAGRVAHGGQR